MKYTGLSNFFRRAYKPSSGKSIGSLSLDPVFKLSPGATTTFVAERNIGISAICLEIATILKDSIYVDCFDSFFSSRLRSNECLVICKPRQVHLLDDIADSLSEMSGTLIIDNPRYLNLDPHKYKRSNLSLITTSRYKDSNSSLNIFVTKGESIYETIAGESVYMGHMLHLYNLLGDESTCFIENKRGRISRGYEIATQLEKLGTSRSSTFIHEDVCVKGFWKFIHEFDRNRT